MEGTAGAGPLSGRSTMRGLEPAPLMAVPYPKPDNPNAALQHSTSIYEQKRFVSRDLTSLCTATWGVGKKGASPGSVCYGQVVPSRVTARSQSEN